MRQLEYLNLALSIRGIVPVTIDPNRPSRREELLLRRVFGPGFLSSTPTRRSASQSVFRSVMRANDICHHLVNPNFILGVVEGEYGDGPRSLTLHCLTNRPENASLIIGGLFAWGVFSLNLAVPKDSMVPSGLPSSDVERLNRLVERQGRRRGAMETIAFEDKRLTRLARQGKVAHIQLVCASPKTKGLDMGRVVMAKGLLEIEAAADGKYDAVVLSCMHGKGDARRRSFYEQLGFKKAKCFFNVPGSPRIEWIEYGEGEPNDVMVLFRNRRTKRFWSDAELQRNLPIPAPLMRAFGI